MNKITIELLKTMIRADGENLVEIIDLGFVIDDKDNDFRKFYIEAIEDIRKKLKQSDT